LDRGHALLQGLRHQLERWFDTIRKATGATRVFFVAHPDGEFALRVEWETKAGEKMFYDRMFTREEVFGASYRNSVASWQVQRRACDYARDCMRQVLSARGVM
jgi:hypothetical protein